MNSLSDRTLETPIVNPSTLLLIYQVATYPQMSNDVDFEGSSDLLLSVLHERLARHDAGVVDQHRHLADFAFDLFSQTVDCNSVCDVTSEVLWQILKY